VTEFNIIPEVKNPPKWINSGGGVIVHPSQRTVDENDTPMFEFDVYPGYQVAKIKTWPVVGPEPDEPGGLICNDCHIGENCVIGNGTQWNESVNCGEDCVIGEDCFLWASLGHSVTVGDRCAINAYVPSDTVIPNDTVWEG